MDIEAGLHPVDADLRSNHPTVRGDPVDLPVTDVKLRGSPRLAGEDQAHVRLLVDSVTPFPPILVHRATMHVIDGAHRLCAARLRGDPTIQAVLFDGSEKDAFVLAVRLNISHGLPLSLADRKNAAERIVREHSQWSDRAVAAVAGLSDKTVGAVRRRTGAEIPQGADRVGRDGVVHHGRRVEGRQWAAELFTADPNTSATKVARAAGISVTTAKDVRKRLRRDEDPVPARRSPCDARPDSRQERPQLCRARVDRGKILRQLRADPSLRFSESGRKLLRWLEALARDWDELVGVADNLPGHSVPIVAELVLQCLGDWERFALLLDEQNIDCLTNRTSRPERPSAGGL